MRFHLTAGASARVAAVVLLATVATAACERGAFGYYGERAILEVTVVRGPIDPTAGEGEDNEEPVQGARVVAHPFAGDYTRSGMTDQAGVVRFQVAPGRWQIFVEVCPGAVRLPDERTVTVQPGSDTAVRITCDTGIR